SDRALDGSNQQNTAETKNIWVMNADGSGLMPLTKLTAANTSVTNPVWSPDSRRLAFSWNRALDNTDAVKPISARNIWVVNVDNSYARPLTKFTAKLSIATDPEWSPDASKLVFSSNGNVWSMNADGSGAIPLTHFVPRLAAVSLNPVWSGDGAKIAFEYTGNIWVMNADGSDAKLVTRSGTVRGRLRWGPKRP
ncbi:MAG TPA: hypothetical protein VFF42_07410, partial [Candidatus Eremiobacteraceae bacterium]|nr:hypothetical protein [Candidatus Eremiobacteraceae bacterium]